MANRSDLERLIGKALLEEGFRKMMLNDPERAAASIGIQLDPQQAKRIRELSAVSKQRLASLTADESIRTSAPTW
jgi:hypothetical protein